MSTTVEKIKAVEDEMARTQKNKATSFHLGQLKAKLAKLRRELLTASQSSGGGGGGVGFDVARTGVASVGFVGFPSVGKSTLLSKLTGTESESAEYEFTTLVTVPGIIRYKGAKIQMLDLPGIIDGAKDGRGRGKQVIAVARTSNMLFIVLDVNKPLAHKQIIEKELEGVGIRVNKSPPDIIVKKKEKGGISITNTVPLTHLDNDEIRAVMSEYRINSAELAFRCDATVEDLIDVLEAPTRRYMPAIYVLNKIDSLSLEELELLYRIPNAVPISSGKDWNLDELLQTMWDRLNLVRVYTKPKGRMPDFSDPVVLRSDHCTVRDFCNQIHKSLVDEFRNAAVYGTSVKHQPQYVGLNHVLEDEDVVTILKK
ncbi:RBG1 (YAL036C) [Zygosaccharomyces parabailii]|nr:RBG1 (YAL036C) [Zygosaccharomyces parabailii]CDH15023.1 RBG1-GTPase, interacts with ribosomes [Zygosaccharomyces bailii ISA1307]